MTKKRQKDSPDMGVISDQTLSEAVSGLKQVVRSSSQILNISTKKFLKKKVGQKSWTTTKNKTPLTRDIWEWKLTDEVSMEDIVNLATVLKSTSTSLVGAAKCIIQARVEQESNKTVKEQSVDILKEILRIEENHIKARVSEPLEPPEEENEREAVDPFKAALDKLQALKDAPERE